MQQTGTITMSIPHKCRAGPELQSPAPGRHAPHSAVSTPILHLQTLFLVDDDGRISGARKPEPSRGPLFSLIRGKASCDWAVRGDVPQDLADELEGLAREEPPASDFRYAPVHAERYMSLVIGRVDSGPAFMFPEAIAQPRGTVFIEDIQLLEHYFPGWKASEIPKRTPIVALVEEGHVVSVCFCARRFNAAAEAGLETAMAFRGRGLGSRVPLGGHWQFELPAKLYFIVHRGATTPLWRLHAS